MSALTPELAAMLAPVADDARVVRLGKVAMLSLLSADRAVTRTTLPAEARALDTDTKGVRRGISEASLDTNARLRSLYEAARRHAPPSTPSRTGHVPAQVGRMTVWALARALILARAATEQREREFERALARLARPFDGSAIATLRAERASLRANRALSAEPAAAAARHAARAKGRAAVKVALGRRKPSGRRLGLDALASSTGLHVNTVARILLDLREEERAAREDREPILPPASLLRLPHRILAHALAVERSYIRALTRAVDRIAAAIRASDLDAFRSARRDGTGDPEGAATAAIVRPGNGIPA